MMQRLKTKTAFRRRLHANARSKLIRFLRDTKVGELSDSQRLRRYWTEFPRVARLGSFLDRALIAQRKAHARAINDDLARRLVEWGQK